MSVSKYIEEVSARIEERVQKNLKEIEANPYPIDDLEQLRKSSPDSALAKLFGPSGEISGQSALQPPAMQQDPVLYKKLNSGAKALKKAQQNEKLKAIDINEILSSRYSAFVQGLATSGSLGSTLTLDEVLSSDPDEFDDTYGLLLDEARSGRGLDDSGVPDASASTVMSAFIELKGKAKAGVPSSGSPINAAATPRVAEEKKESAVNLPSPAGASQTGVEKVSSTVSGTEVKIPEEIVPPKEPISINIESESTKKEETLAPQVSVEVKAGEVSPPVPEKTQAVSPILPTPEATSTTTTINEGPKSTFSETKSESTAVNQTSTINAQATPEKSTSTETSETSSTSFIERYLGSLTPEYESGLETLLRSPASTSKTKTSTERSSETINSTEKTRATSSRESATSTSAKSESTVNSLEKGGTTLSSSNIGEYLKYIEMRTGSSGMDSKEKSAALSESTSSVEKSSFEKTNVTKEAPSFSEKIAPAPSPVKSESSTSGLMPTAEGTQPSALTVEKVSSGSQVASSTQPSPDAPNNAAKSVTQMGGLEELTKRMTRIEYLLSNPLEVKLVD